jgi:hypothetical protein
MVPDLLPGNGMRNEGVQVTVVEEVVMLNAPERVVPRQTIARWPVDWSAAWVGALSGMVVLLVIALIGVAVGAHRTATSRIVRWSDFGLGSLLFTVLGAFLAFVVAGWVSARIAGFVRSEPAMLHGAIAWLLGVSLVIAVGTTGAAPFGPWYSGVVVLRPAGPVIAEDADSARAARNAALGAVGAVLLGLVGAVVGGWMASGEPMTLTHYRTREERRAA